MKEKIILHIDVNNAFLSWTAIDKLKNENALDIRNRFAIIAGDESQRRGIVLAKSNLCKQKGVVTAEPIYSARRKCPYLEIYKPDFEVYKNYSNLMYKYLCQYSNIIERYSIDECFVDYTDSVKLFGNPIDISYKIKEEIKNKLGFTVNVGIGNNKLCAKMASDFVKPDRVHTLFKNEIETKLWPLDVSELFMIGKSTSKKLKEFGINTIKDLAQTDPVFLEKNFKSLGILMTNYAWGRDDSEVESDYGNPKSISSSTVLPYNYKEKKELLKVLKNLSIDTGSRLRKKGMYARTIQIWIKYNNFQKISKQIKLNNAINTDMDIFNNASLLFNMLWSEEPIRALCVGVSDLSDNLVVQLSLFNSEKQLIHNDTHLQETIDNIKSRYGDNIINYADTLKDKKD